MTEWLWAAATALLVMAFACLWRAEAGPTSQDRLLAVNVAGVKTVVVLALLATIAGHAFLLDVAIVYGLLNVVVTLAATRFIETRRFGGPGAAEPAASRDAPEAAP